MTNWKVVVVLMTGACALLAVTARLDAEDKSPSQAVAPFDVAKAKRHQEAWAKHLKSEVEITNTIGMKLRLIPAGSFYMGTSGGKVIPVQKPLHQVRLTQPFYLSRYETTQGDWKAIMGTSPWKGEDFVKEGNKHPAVWISWDEAVEFCNRLSRKEGTPSN